MLAILGTIFLILIVITWFEEIIALTVLAIGACVLAGVAFAAIMLIAALSGVL